VVRTCTKEPAPAVNLGNKGKVVFADKAVSNIPEGGFVPFCVVADGV